ncbi:RNA polymerase subunit sigma [Rodentibacter genomosp. 1]|uniref:RNA polymerase sigma factor n=1 Tax=Rodentibacter genomosp. 1 TaxID=1908264 RepID=A0A1V3J9C2_9PAST|nr:sigma-70 family RNA polymerase sigma factor [Rodentibacter genomosp. 1]OOF52058.1 RNA polymerase subunit sigma [Rodentibacter genomosp. 1]
MVNHISEKELTVIRQQMLKFAELQLHNHELAEDLVQESFLSAFKHIDRFKREAAFKTWIFAILKNKIIDYFRQKGRFVLESEMIEEDDSPNTFFDEAGHWNLAFTPSNLQEYEEKVYAEEFWLIFETCLTCLPSQQARIFMMREFLELSSDEICEETQLSTSNLHTTLYRARLQLQHCLSQKL